jgi:hypothetical protein
LGHSYETQKRLMRGTIPDPAMRTVVIVLPDPAADRLPRFLHVAIFRRPDFLFLQAAMESFDVAVAFRVMIGRAPMPASQPSERLDEPR